MFYVIVQARRSPPPVCDSWNILCGASFCCLDLILAKSVNQRTIYSSSTVDIKSETTGLPEAMLPPDNTDWVKLAISR